MHVTILRGISGCGKSTWIKNRLPGATVVSADHLFIQPDGSYRFDRSRLGEAHRRCLRAFLDALHRGEPSIAVDNTNVTAWEISPYAFAAEAYGYTVEIVTLSCDPETAIARKDWVPPADVRRTAGRLEAEAAKFPPTLKALHRVEKND